MAQLGLTVASSLATASAVNMHNLARAVDVVQVDEDERVVLLAQPDGASVKRAAKHAALEAAEQAKQEEPEESSLSQLGFTLASSLATASAVNMQNLARMVDPLAQVDEDERVVLLAKPDGAVVKRAAKHAALEASEKAKPEMQEESSLVQVATLTA